MKRALVIFIAALMMTGVFCACNNNEQTKSTATADSAETTVVLETTAQGGTIEKDSEDNIITKDENGKVVKVEDKNGKTIEVSEYLTTHSWVENSSSSGGGSKSSSAADDSKTGSNSGDSKTDSSESSEKKSTDEKKDSNKTDEGLEEEIPVVVATITEEQDKLDIPDL